MYVAYKLSTYCFIIIPYAAKTLSLSRTGYCILECNILPIYKMKPKEIV